MIIVRAVLRQPVVVSNMVKDQKLVTGQGIKLMVLRPDGLVVFPDAYKGKWPPSIIPLTNVELMVPDPREWAGMPDAEDVAAHRFDAASGIKAAVERRNAAGHAAEAIRGVRDAMPPYLPDPAQDASDAAPPAPGGVDLDALLASSEEPAPPSEPKPAKRKRGRPRKQRK